MPEEIRSDQFDLPIIGGDGSGCETAADAATRGLTTATTAAEDDPRQLY